MDSRLKQRKNLSKKIQMLGIIAIMLISLMPVFSSTAIGAAPAWAPNTAYSAGDLVTYNGSTYSCLQPHTSLVGWEPPNVPALWTLQTGGPTPTPTATPTPTPTATPTATPTPTPTGTPGTCSAPAWNPSTAYSGGAQVSYNGKIYQANWWTQGDQPDTHSGQYQVWSFVSNCTGGTPTPTPTATPTPTPTSTSGPGGSEWLDAAPYLMPLDNDAPDAGTVMDATGIKAFTLAFILANGSSCSAAWDGHNPVSSDTAVAAVINAIRAKGGDVVVSIGGYGGTKLGQVCSSPAATAAAYQQVIDKYDLKAIDFDIEEPEIENTAAVNNELGAAKILQQNAAAAGKSLNVQVTLPVLGTGLNYFGGLTVQAAVDMGFTPNSWSVMPFDDGGSSMGSWTTGIIEAVHNQLKGYYPGKTDAQVYAMQGVSLMNGRSDIGEYTSVADFNTITSYARSKGLKRVTFWSVNRDRQCSPVVDPGTKGTCSSVAQNDWDFTRAIKKFITG